MQRDTSFRGFTIDDVKWLWAAYKKGAFEGSFLGPDMDKEEFTTSVVEHLSAFNEVFLLETETKRGKIPVGLVSLVTTNGSVPHVDWFPWASARNKIEAITCFFSKMRNRPMLVWVRDIDIKFYTHVSKYGVLRRIGKVYKFGSDNDYMLFQTRSM